MNTAKRELIRRTLQKLAESQATTLELLERTFSLIGDELGIDAVTFWRARATAGTQPTIERLFHVDPDRLQVVFQGKRCELDDAFQASAAIGQTAQYIRYSRGLATRRVGRPPFRRSHS